MSIATCTKCGKSWRIENADDLFSMIKEMILKEPEPKKLFYQSLPLFHKIDMGKIKADKEITVIVER